MLQTCWKERSDAESCKEKVTATFFVLHINYRNNVCVLHMDATVFVSSRCGALRFISSCNYNHHCVSCEKVCWSCPHFLTSSKSNRSLLLSGLCVLRVHTKKPSCGQLHLLRMIHKSLEITDISHCE